MSPRQRAESFLRDLRYWARVHNVYLDFSGEEESYLIDKATGTVLAALRGEDIEVTWMVE